MIDISASLIDRLKRGQVVLVAGLGCSRLAGAPGWEELALRLADWVEDDARKMGLKELVAVGRCADAIAYLGARLPRQVVLAVLRDAYPVRDEAPEAIAALARIPWRGVISTGYDGLWAVESGGGKGAGPGRAETRIFAPHEGAALAEHRGRFLWHLAGLTSVPESVGLGGFEARRPGPGAPAAIGTTLHLLAEQSSFVFVGFRPGDPDLVLIAQQLAGALGGGPHFLFVTGARELETDLVEADLGVTAVTIEGPLDGALRALHAAFAPVGAARPGDDDIEAWLAMWARDPADPEPRVVLARAEARLREERSWRRLVQLLLGRVELGTDRAERVAVLRGVARVYDGPLEAPEPAFTALATAFRLEPDAEGLLAEVERAAAKAGRRPELLAAYTEICAELGDAPTAMEHRLERARMLAEELARIPEAVDGYRDVLARDPGNRRARLALSELLERAERWAELATTLAERADREDDPALAAALRSKLAELQATRLDDVSAAIASYERVLAHDPARREALAAVEPLYARAGREEQVRQTVERLAGLAESDDERLPLLRRLAAAWEASADGLERATDTLQQILRIDARDGEALAALARLHRQARRWPALVETLTSQIGATDNPLATRALWAELGQVSDEELHDAARAADAYAAAVALGDERETTVARLARLEEQAERWAAAVEALDKLAAVAREPAARADALVRSARIVDEKLADPSAAEARCVRALELDGEHVGALASLAALCRGQGDVVRAAELMREAAACTADPGEKVRLLYDLGVLHQDQLADPAEATALLGLVLQNDPEHVPAAERLAALYTQAERWVELEPVMKLLARRAGDATAPPTPAMMRGLGELHLRRADWREAARLYQAVVDGPEAASLPPAEMADVHDRLARCHTELGNRGQAIAAHQAVLALAPGRRPTLHQLIELYTAEKRWREAAGAWLRLADLEDRPLPRAKCLYAAALIHQDELSDADWAVALYNRALDHAPELTKAFDAAEQLLTRTAAWKELAQHHRKMIKRLPSEGFSDLRLRLWSGLGEVCLTRLGDLEMAVTALEVAASLDRGNVQRREQLAAVYLQAGSDHHDKAIAEHQWLIAHNPDRLASYRALAELYGETGAVDKLWCVAATLAFLRKADSGLLRLYETHRAQEFRPARRAFTEDVWQQLVHPDEDPFIVAIFMLLGRFVAMATAPQHQSMGLQRKERVDLAADERLPTQVLRYVVGTLDLPPPDLFFNEGAPESLALFNLQESGMLTPALVVGKGIEHRASEGEMVFEMGKRLAYLRPERFVRHAAPGAAGLDLAVRAALELGGAPLGSGVHNGEVGRLTAELRRVVPRPIADKLGAVGRALVSARGEVIDVQAWIAATDLTAARVGFVLTNDLAAAARVISSEPPGTSPLSAKQRLKDLLAYSVSESYFAVRKFLGLDIVQSSSAPRLPVPEPHRRHVP